MYKYKKNNFLNVYFFKYFYDLSLDKLYNKFYMFILNYNKYVLKL
jgi:hypothetical protein